MSKKLDFEKAAENLHELIRECGSDTLAAIYENAFGAIKTCELSEDNCYFIVTYHEGLEEE